MKCMDLKLHEMCGFIAKKSDAILTFLQFLLALCRNDCLNRKNMNYRNFKEMKTSIIKLHK